MQEISMDMLGQIRCAGASSKPRANNNAAGTNYNDRNAAGTHYNESDDFRFGCSLPSLSGAASAFGVGFGSGVTLGATTGTSTAATALGYIGTALVGSALAGYSIGVGINHLAGVCD